MRTPPRLTHRYQEWTKSAGFGAACFVLAASLAACSSSKDGAYAGFDFGGDSSFGDAGHGHPTTKKDAGTTPPKKDSGSATKPTSDASCGSTPPSDWCTTNAPTLTSGSNVRCDDFDIGRLDSVFNYEGINPNSYISGRNVSPYCALQALIGDGGGAPTVGAFTEHPYPLISGTASATLAFDLYVPSGAACERAVVGRFLATASGSYTDAAVGWISISDIAGSGSAATSYTLSMTAVVGAMGDGGSGGTASTPVTVTVTPSASDHGWARVELDVTAYSIAANPASISGTATWFTLGDTKAKGTSAVGSATGQLVLTAGSGADAFDFGVIPSPLTGNAPPGCEVFIDDAVSNVTTN